MGACVTLGIPSRLSAGVSLTPLHLHYHYDYDVWKRDVGLCRLLADCKTVREMTGYLTHLLESLFHHHLDVHVYHCVRERSQGLGEVYAPAVLQVAPAGSLTHLLGSLFSSSIASLSF